MLPEQQAKNCFFRKLAKQSRCSGRSQRQTFRFTPGFGTQINLPLPDAKIPQSKFLKKWAKHECCNVLTARNFHAWEITGTGFATVAFVDRILNPDDRLLHLTVKASHSHLFTPH